MSEMASSRYGIFSIWPLWIDRYFQEAVKARFDAWNKLASIEGIFDDQILDDTKEERTIKLLENAVMLMEGASEEDVKLINSGTIL